MIGFSIALVSRSSLLADQRSVRRPAPRGVLWGRNFVMAKKNSAARSRETFGRMLKVCADKGKSLGVTSRDYLVGVATGEYPNITDREMTDAKPDDRWMNPREEKKGPTRAR